MQITVDDDAAAERLSDPGRAKERSAGPAAAGPKRTSGLGTAMASVWRERGVLDLKLVTEMIPALDRRPPLARDPFEPRFGKWAAVALREDAAAAKEALAPLLELRRSEGLAFDPKGDTPGFVVIDRPAADKPFLWEEALRDVTGAPPHHLLLLGGPERFPFAVVSWWSARRIVGVLDVADDPLGPLSWPAVHRYARKVCDQAAGQHAISRRALVYAFRSDGATRRSYEKLATPLLQYLTDQALKLPAATQAPLRLLGDAATTHGLIDTLRTERPALVLTCTHGLEYPPDPKLWGALTSVDHSKPSGSPLSVDSITVGEPFAEGGVVFAFACFSAGIPDKSALIELVSPNQADPIQVPRIAPLPRLILGQDRGPLAFIGHVDRASTSSFAGFDGPTAFQDLADFVLGGLGTVGQGMSTFWEEALRAADDLVTVLKPDAMSTPQQKVAAWVRRLDTAGWLLLGDPCVRLFPPPATAGSSPD